MPAASSKTSTKKRKQVEASEPSSEHLNKKLKKEERKKKKHDKKGKSKASVVEGEFKVMKASLLVSISPKFANKPMNGVEELLDSLIMQHVHTLQGVLLCYSNLRFLSNTGRIMNECPFINFNVGFDATVWSPQIGMKLSGKINLCSPDHVSLLVHQTFNVSIPRHHIQKDYWEFEYGPAENDPEFGPEAANNQNEDDNAIEVDGDPSIEMTVRNSGKWVHNTSREPLGGAEGRLDFTVIGLTIANDMLSLVGSLQEDPLSEAHQPRPAVLARKDLASELVEAINGAAASSTDEAVGYDTFITEEDDEADDDAFAVLGKMSDAAIAKAAAEEAQEEAEKKAEKKRKKKDKDKSHKSDKKAKKDHQ